MSVQGHTTDIGFILMGTVTGFFGLHLTEIDIIMGIVLKLVSIVSFVIAISIGLKKLFKKDYNGRD